LYTRSRRTVTFCAPRASYTSGRDASSLNVGCCLLRIASAHCCAEARTAQLRASTKISARAMTTCTRCAPEGVVVWNETALCTKCFLAASIRMATGRTDLYLTLRTLPPRAADHVIRAILRQITASLARGWRHRNSSHSGRWRDFDRTAFPLAPQPETATKFERARSTEAQQNERAFMTSGLITSVGPANGRLTAGRRGPAASESRRTVFQPNSIAQPKSRSRILRDYGEVTHCLRAPRSKPSG
jgi:hypothetical protein